MNHITSEIDRLKSNLEEKTQEEIQFETKLDILEKTDLNWTVKKEQLVRPIETETGIEYIPTDTYGLFRSDNGFQLNRGVSNSYEPYQNSKLVSDIYHIVGEYLNKDLSGVKGGFFRGGKLVYIQFDLGVAEIGRDKMPRFLTFTNSHNGSSSIKIGFSSMVISCSNSFYSVSKDVNLNSFRHTVNSIKKIDLFREDILNQLKEEVALVGKMRRLVDSPISKEDIDFVKESIIPTKELTLDNISTRKFNQIKNLENSIALSLEKHGNDKWGLFNSATHYNTHVIKDGHYKTMFGDAMKQNNKILDYLYEQTVN